MVKRLASSLVKRFGAGAGHSHSHPGAQPQEQYPDLEEKFLQIFEKCRSHTMTSVERMYALYHATQHVAKNSIPGAIVECGVWKGGSSMVAAYALLGSGDSARAMYLYDTFEGMAEPAERDIDYARRAAATEWRDSQRENHNAWCYSPLEEVQANVYSTGYPREKIVFVKGKVEETIPDVLPDRIAVLRLDTDWYESTYHELTHLFPRLSPDGILIVDDYGHWQGCREAVDQYFSEHKIKILLSRIDYTGRVAVKPR